MHTRRLIEGQSSEQCPVEFSFRRERSHTYYQDALTYVKALIAGSSALIELINFKYVFRVSVQALRFLRYLGRTFHNEVKNVNGLDNAKTI